MKIKDNCVVAFSFTLKGDSGEVLDSATSEDPIRYLHGCGGLISGLEQALTGKEAGEQLQVTVAPQDAYGELNPELIQEIPLEVFEGIDELEVGMQLQAEGGDGHPQIITVKEIKGELVTIDANPPLAGETLHFDVKIEAVREASTSEIAHGHVH